MEKQLLSSKSGNGVIGWGSTEFIVMRARSPVLKPFSYILARGPAFRANAIQSMTRTSGRQRARTDMISDYIVVVPDEPAIWTKFADLVILIFEAIAVNAGQSSTLAATRDYLLWKLMSSEVRVRNAEKIAEAAA